MKRKISEIYSIAFVIGWFGLSIALAVDGRWVIGGFMTLVMIFGLGLVALSLEKEEKENEDEDA